LGAYDRHVVREFRLTQEPLPGTEPPTGEPDQAPAPKPVKLVDTQGELSQVQTLRLGHGHRLAVERERSQYEFVGGKFYMASRALSEYFPYLGLTALQYDLWHTLCGVQSKGGIIGMTQQQLADRLQTERNRVGEALRLFEDWGLLYRPTRGRICLNPRITFYGTSEQQAEALADLPDSVPHITLPSAQVRPRSRKQRTGPKGVQA
jgi:hypothetical protein